MTATHPASGNTANYADPAFCAPMDERQLLARLRAEEPQAQEAFVRLFGGRLLAVARRFLRCEQDCADAVQDAFISAFASLESFEDRSRIATWLHRIVVNACLMKLRSRARKSESSIDDLLPTFDETGHHASRVARWSDAPTERMEVAETRAQVRACIDRLPPDYRTILLLRDIEEVNTEETARLLKMSIPNVKTRLHRARQALRTLLDPMFRAQ